MPICKLHRVRFSGSAHRGSNPVQEIKDLYICHDGRHIDHRIANVSIKKANEIYDQIPDKNKDHYIMNTMIKLFLHFEKPDHIKHIWTDIASLPPYQLSKLSYPILLKCLITSTDNNIDHCITALSWMKQKEFRLRIHTKFITILIGKCQSDYVALNIILSFINERYIETDESIVIKTAFIKAFSQHNDSTNALAVFNTISQPDAICIYEIMRTFLNVNDHRNVLQIFRAHNQRADDLCLSLAVQACIISDDYQSTISICNLCAPSHYSQLSNSQKNAMIDLFCKFDDSERAESILVTIPSGEWDAYPVGLIMKSYLNQQQNDKVLEMYETMISKKDAVIHSLAIKACIESKDIVTGNKIHESLCRHNTIDNSVDVLVQNALINMFAEFGDVDRAFKVFESIAADMKDIVTISNMMKAYIYTDNDEKALSLYRDIGTVYSQITADHVSHILALKACDKLGDLSTAKNIDHSTSSLHQSVELKRALIEVYGTCGDITNAVNTFNSIQEPQRNVSILNTMMIAYCRNEQYSECIRLYRNYKSSELYIPSIATYNIVLSACTNTTSFYFGRQIHEELREKDGDILRDRDIQINLLNLYGKCGKLTLCDELFDAIRSNDISIWNAMIHAFGRNGDLNRVLSLYDEIKAMKTINPDHKTFTFMIYACSHHGDVATARNIWMNEVGENLKYDMYLIGSLVDCMARNGALQEARDLIEIYENQTSDGNLRNRVMYNSLIAGCKKYGNDTMARSVYDDYRKRFGSSDSSGTTSMTVAMSNIVGSGDELDFRRVNKIRDEMKLKGVSKVPGISEIEIDGEIYKFYAGENGIYDQEIAAKMQDILKEMNTVGIEYVPDAKCVTRQLNVGESAEKVLLSHSEKQAVIFGLLRSPSNLELFINKNLRICNDCHNFMKLLTKVIDRKIVIGDANRVHVFNGGICSCADRW